MTNRIFKSTEQIVGVAILAMLLFGCFFVIRPFISIFLWAAILVFATWPVNEWFVRLFRGRRTLAAATMTLILTLIVVIPIWISARSLAGSAANAYNAVVSLASEAPPKVLERINFSIAGHHVGETLAQQWTLTAQRLSKFTAEESVLSNCVKYAFRSLIAIRGATGFALRGVAAVFDWIVQIALSILVSFFLYRDGHSIAARFSTTVANFVGDYTQSLIDLVARTIRAVIYGLIGTAIAQGIAAGIVYASLGIRSWLFWALITCLFALLPIGPPIIWGGISLGLLFTGHWIKALILLFLGTFVISGIDNITRPLIINRYAKLSFISVFFGIIGGVLAFGFLGIFLGPTLLAVGINLIQYLGKRRETEKREARAQLPNPEKSAANETSAMPCDSRKAADF